jgi:hypothetical protein
MNKFPFNQEQIMLIALLVFPLETAWQTRENKEIYQFINCRMILGLPGCFW